MGQAGAPGGVRRVCKACVHHQPAWQRRYRGQKYAEGARERVPAVGPRRVAAQRRSSSRSARELSRQSAKGCVSSSGGGGREDGHAGLEEAWRRIPSCRNAREPGWVAWRMQASAQGECVLIEGHRRAKSRSGRDIRFAARGTVQAWHGWPRARRCTSASVIEAKQDPMDGAGAGAAALSTLSAHSVAIRGRTPRHRAAERDTPIRRSREKRRHELEPSGGAGALEASEETIRSG